MLVISPGLAARHGGLDGSQLRGAARLGRVRKGLSCGGLALKDWQPNTLFAGHHAVGGTEHKAHIWRVRVAFPFMDSGKVAGWTWGSSRSVEPRR